MQSVGADKNRRKDRELGLLTNRGELTGMLILMVQLRLKNSQRNAFKCICKTRTHSPVVALVRLDRNRRAVALHEVVGVVDVLEPGRAHD